MPDDMVALSGTAHAGPLEASTPFCEQKESKKTFLIRATGARTSRLQPDKSFLRRFFAKKRPLTFR
jgi:hypothetical protein